MLRVHLQIYEAYSWLTMVDKTSSTLLAAYLTQKLASRKKCNSELDPKMGKQSHGWPRSATKTTEETNDAMVEKPAL